MAIFEWEIQLMVRWVTNSGPSYTEIFRQWKTVLLTFYDQSSFTSCIQDDFKIHGNNFCKTSKAKIWYIQKNITYSVCFHSIQVKLLTGKSLLEVWKLSVLYDKKVPRRNKKKTLIVYDFVSMQFCFGFVSWTVSVLNAYIL